MNSNQDVIFDIDIVRETVTVHQSGPWSASLGFVTGREYEYTSTVEALVDRFFDRDDKEPFLRAAELSSVRAAFIRQVPLLSRDVRIRRPNSERYEWHRVTIIAPIDNKCNGTIQNIQDEKEAELKMRRQAERDALTDLLNRTAFDREVRERFARGVTHAAFLILDIDNFKEINDTKGHQFGDVIITEMAGQLRGIAPENAVIGRFGGDEYMLFLSTDVPDVSPAQFRQAIEKLCKNIIGMDKSADYTLSLGASFFPTDGETTSELLSCADRALYYVKHNGKDNYALFDDAMPASFVHREEQSRSKRRLRRRPVDIRAAMPIFIALLTAIVFLAFLTNAYLDSLQRMIREESLDYLHEITQQIGVSTVNTLRFYTAQAGVVGETLTVLKPPMDMTALCAFLEGKSDDLGCKAIAAVDDKAIWHTVGKQSKRPELNDYLANCLIEQRVYMSEAVDVESVDYALIFVPVEYATTDGIDVCAIVVFIPFDMMNQILTLSAFEGNGHADVLTMDGRVVVRAGHEDCIVEGYNLFTGLQKRTFVGDTDFAQMRATYTAGESGSFRLLVGEREFILYYGKLGYQDWMLLTSVPADILEARSQAFLRITLLACLGIALVFCVLMAGAMILQARSKAKLEKIAYVDRITGSATRNKFQMDVARLLALRDTAYTMVYTNVDRFKVINDRLGTDGANSLLRWIAQSLEATRQEDEAVGRIDADHFGVLLNTQDREAIRKRIRAWNRAIAKFQPEGQSAVSLSVSMSYGVYAIEDPTLPIDLLLDRSNLARSSQEKGSDKAQRIYFYDNKLRERLLHEQSISDSMEEALAQGRFHMYLQPQYAARSGRLVGYEALARWQTPELGLLYPGEFIPVFERNGFIIKLDLYMFEQVCKTQRELQDKGKRLPIISFNVSRVHLNEPDLLAPYLAIWEKYRVPQNLLEFEFTESVISDNPERLRQVIDELHQHGFRCSMDDFGAGYSSLNMLNTTNVDVVKIDRSFLGGGMEPSPRSKAIIRAVVQLAKELGMETVAEGVEYSLQASFLKEVGCDLIQGYYYGKPMPAKAALLLLDR